MADNEQKYIRVRLKFSRKGPVKYLGHLDMLRYFQKVMLRANIDIRYSEGFNPHQIMSFAYPLGVSMETTGDYLDIDLVSYDGLEDLVTRLNKVMNEGIAIESAKLLEEKALNAMAAVYAAGYKITVSSNEMDQADLTKDKLDLMCQELLAKPEIIISKKKCGKKKKEEVVEKDIKEGIFELKADSDGVLYMLLKSGSALNIKPVSVIEALSENIGKNLKVEARLRTDIYGQAEDGSIVSLSQ